MAHHVGISMADRLRSASWRVAQQECNNACHLFSPNGGKTATIVYMHLLNCLDSRHGMQGAKTEQEPVSTYCNSNMYFPHNADHSP